MDNNKRILRLNRNREIFNDYETAESYLKSNEIIAERLDGEILIARYYADNERTIIESLIALYSVNEDDRQVSILRKSADLSVLSYELNYDNPDNFHVLTGIKQDEGLIAATDEALSQIVLGQYTNTGETGDIDNSMTLEQALSVLENNTSDLQETVDNIEIPVKAQNGGIEDNQDGEWYVNTDNNTIEINENGALSVIGIDCGDYYTEQQH